jgi:putative flippase GtrA
MLKNEFARYIVNGVIATLVHYAFLNANIYIFQFDNFGLANALAACFGILCSFLGSRYYVYRKHNNSIVTQAFRFVLLYFCIALLHGLLLYGWSDVYGLSHHIGFVLATFLQFLLSYFGNKILVFRK